MILTSAHSRLPRDLSFALALSLALCCSSVALAAAATPTRPEGAGESSARYPSAATRPALRPHGSEYAHASSSGGAAAPGATPPARTPATSTTPAKGTVPARKRKPAKPVLHGDPARALAAYQAMQKVYYVPGSGLYAGEPFSYLWPFSQALAATVSMAYIPHTGVSFAHELRAELFGLRSYLDTDNSGAPEGIYTSTLAAYDGEVAPPTGPGGPKYYDDNDWIGIELARLYELTRSPALLSSAEAIMAFEMAGWDASPELSCPGGIPFSNSATNNARNTVTTAPAAELALQLYRITGSAADLQFARTAYEWVRGCLVTANQLYADHIGPKGGIEPALWSYNQGAMIGAGTLLYQATGDSAYLYQARQTARSALAYFTPARLGAENPFFVSVYFRNLMYLDSVTHDAPGAKIAQAYVDYAWAHLRLSDDVFVAGSPASAQLLVQAAIVQIYALLSSPASTYF